MFCHSDVAHRIAAIDQRPLFAGDGESFLCYIRLATNSRVTDSHRQSLRLTSPVLNQPQLLAID